MDVAAGNGVVTGLRELDVQICRVVRGRTDDSAMVPVGQAISLVGEHAGVWLATAAAGLVLDRRRRSRWMIAAGAVVGAHAAAMGVKRVIRRERPNIPGLPTLTSTASGLSFPSAHAASSAAAAVAFTGGLLPRRVIIPMATATCASRIMLGAHYPSDVLVGAVIGTAVGTAARRRMNSSR